MSPIGAAIIALVIGIVLLLIVASHIAHVFGVILIILGGVGLFLLLVEAIFGVAIFSRRRRLP